MLYDKIGVRLLTDLDKMEFFLQKQISSTPLWKSGLQWRFSDSRKRRCPQLVQLLRARLDKGIFDKDPDLRTNFGFVDGRPIQLDIGRFKKQLAHNSADDLIRITDRLCAWLDERAPALAEHVRKEVR